MSHFISRVQQLALFLLSLVRSFTCREIIAKVINFVGNDTSSQYSIGATFGSV